MSAVDAAQVDLMLTALRLPTVKAVWQSLAERADKEGWPAARLLAALAELEIAERTRRRLATPVSNPDCRGVLILLDAPHTASTFRRRLSSRHLLDHPLLPCYWLRWFTVQSGAV